MLRPCDGGFLPMSTQRLWELVCMRPGEVGEAEAECDVHEGAVAADAVQLRLELVEIVGVACGRCRRRGGLRCCALRRAEAGVTDPADIVAGLVPAAAGLVTPGLVSTGAAAVAERVRVVSHSWLARSLAVRSGRAHSKGRGRGCRVADLEDGIVLKDVLPLQCRSRLGEYALG